MFAYPYMAHALLAPRRSRGLFLGTGIHDTSQVMGAALSYKEIFHDERALQVAAVDQAHAKSLSRRGRSRARLFLCAPARIGKAESFRAKALSRFHSRFLALAVVRSLGDASLARGRLALGLSDAAAWKEWTTRVGETWASGAWRRRSRRSG